MYYLQGKCVHLGQEVYFLHIITTQTKNHCNVVNKMIDFHNSKRMFFPVNNFKATFPIFEGDQKLVIIREKVLILIEMHENRTCHM